MASLSTIFVYLKKRCENWAPSNFLRQIGPRKIFVVANWAPENLLVANWAPKKIWRQIGPRQIGPRQIGPKKKDWWQIGHRKIFRWINVIWRVSVRTSGSGLANIPILRYTRSSEMNKHRG